MFCSVALVLLVDTSGSISSENMLLQRDAYVQAFQEPRIRNIILSQAPVALSYVEWNSSPREVVKWTLIETEGDLEEFSQAIFKDAATNSQGQTGLGEALDFALASFHRTPCEEIGRMVIDISGDGISNYGQHPAAVRDSAQKEPQVQINGLPILNTQEPTLEPYYRENVITYDGFLIPVEGYTAIYGALVRKLNREIANVTQ